MALTANRSPKVVTRMIGAAKVGSGRLAHDRHVQAVIDANPLPKDTLDHALDASAATGERVDYAKAHPEPPPPVESLGDPSERLTRIGGMDDALAYNREYKLRTLHRLLMRNIPVSLISQQMGIGPHEVARLRQILNKRLRAEASRIDTFSFFGRSMAFYDEVRGMALRVATDATVRNGKPAVTVTNKLQAMQAAIAADQAKMRFLDMAGFFDYNRFLPKPSEETDSVERGRKSLDLIFKASRHMLGGEENVDYGLEEIEEDPDMMLPDDDAIELL